VNLVPLLYDAHHSLLANDIPFWLALAKDRGGPILELGCGTGRILIKLAEDGFRAFGLDNDQEMLLYLYERAGSLLPVRPAVFQADMEAFHLDQKFPLIIMPCNTLSTLSEASRKIVFQKVKDHLSAGGLFAASLPNPAALVDLEPAGENEVEEVFYLSEDGRSVQVSSQWEKEADWFHLHWIYDLLESDGRIQRFEILTSHSLDSVSVYQSDLASAGLRVANLFGGPDFSPYEEDSEDLIILAEMGSG
jgi:SAM-dependent methyltransferase